MAFGYKPTASRSRLMSASDDPSGDEDECVETIRQFVKEELQGVYFFGLKRCQPDDIKKGWPKLYGYLVKNYGDFLQGCKYCTKRVDKLSPHVPYVLLPDTNMSILTWDEKNKCPAFSQNEDLARAIERLK